MHQMHSPLLSAEAVAAVETGALDRPGFQTRMLDYLTLMKPRIIVLLAGYGLMAALVAGGGHVPGARLAAFALLALMAAGGAACLNQLFEREGDALMERTRSRPLPAGRVTPAAAAWLAGMLLALSVGLALAWLGAAVAVQLAMGAAVYSGLYTVVLKRRTTWNIVIGGAAGSNMALAGWAVADPHLGAGAWLLALLIYLWTPPHFWGLAIARDADYRAAGIPMLPQVEGLRRTAAAMLRYAIALWAVSLAVVPLTSLGMVYGAAAAVLGAGFTGLCASLWRRPSPRLAMTVFKMSGLYLLLLLLGMGADFLVMAFSIHGSAL
jgi:heme o synthase